MPELPEVQTVVEDLRRAGIPGSRIVRARVRLARTVAAPSPAAFCRGLAGRTIDSVSRRAKFIVMQLSDGTWLLVHLRMTGQIHIDHAGSDDDPHDRLCLELADGRVVRYHDTRTFGRWYLVDDPQRILAKLGPEPLEPAFTAGVLATILKSHGRMLKPLLLDQTVLAGLGNIYVDEALWTARLHPCRRSTSVSAVEARRLHAAIRQVLRKGIRNMGTTLGTGETNFYSVGKRRGRNRDQLNVFRRTGQPCPRCGEAIRRMVVGQRSTHVCGRCQKR